jgi:hypothetical protein
VWPGSMSKDRQAQLLDIEIKNVCGIGIGMLLNRQKQLRCWHSLLGRLRLISCKSAAR